MFIYPPAPLLHQHSLWCLLSSSFTIFTKAHSLPFLISARPPQPRPSIPPLPSFDLPQDSGFGCPLLPFFYPGPRAAVSKPRFSLSPSVPQTRPSNFFLRQTPFWTSHFPYYCRRRGRGVWGAAEGPEGARIAYHHAEGRCEHNMLRSGGE